PCAFHVMSKSGCSDKKCTLQHGELCTKCPSNARDQKCTKLHRHHVVSTKLCNMCSITRLPETSRFNTCQPCWKSVQKGKPCATKNCIGIALPKTSYC